MEKFIYNPSTMVTVDVKGWIRLAQYAGTDMILAKEGTVGYKEFDENDNDKSYLTTPKPNWDFRHYKSFHKGLIGEIAYALKAGLNPNVELLSFGDGNSDFTGGVDIKSTWTNKLDNTTDLYLVENCYKKDKGQLAKYYVKANVNLENETVVLVGWCTAAELCNGEIKNYGKGGKYGDNGDRYALHYTKLKPYYTLPPYILAATNKLKQEREETLATLTDIDDIAIYKAMVNKRMECLKKLYIENTKPKTPKPIFESQYYVGGKEYNERKKSWWQL
jgi:hypothetical protein